MRALFFLALSACWSPELGAPANATVVFHVDPEAQEECGTGAYIGDVALGTTDGYATILQWLPASDCNQTGGDVPSVPVPVVRFALDGVAPPVPAIPTAGMTRLSSTPRVAFDGTGFVWVGSDDINGPVPLVVSTPDDPEIAQLGTPQGSMRPAGLVANAGEIYVAAWSPPPGGSESNNPSYPCCGNSNEPSQTTGALWRVSTGGIESLPAQPFACEHAGTCFAANTADLVFAVEVMDVTTVHRLPKAGGGDASLGTLPAGHELVGIAANDRYVVWTSSPATRRFPLPAPACNVTIFDLATNNLVGGLASVTFSCGGVAIDETHAYFAITEVPEDSGDNQPYGMRGLGIGRVAFADGTVETLALGMRGRAAGPRRVLLHGDAMFAIDPAVIGRLDKAALDGRHDF